MMVLRVSLQEFELFVREGVAAIPKKFRARIKNVAFLVDERPTAKQRREHALRRGETLFGLYEGIPHTARGEGYGWFVLPDRITIFKQPTEAKARFLTGEHSSNNIRSYTIAKRGREKARRDTFKNQVRRLVIDTVWHEVAHHFGLDEARVEERESERERERRNSLLRGKIRS